MVENNHEFNVSNLSIRHKESKGIILNPLESFEIRKAQHDSVSSMNEQLDLGNSRHLQVVLRGLFLLNNHKYTVCKTVCSFLSILLMMA